MRSKAGIYEVVSSDGTKTYLHASSETGARKAVKGPKRTVAQVADSWAHWQEIKAANLNVLS